jgi:hypothetical protein
MPSFRWDHSRHLGLTVSRQGFLAELANTEGECDQVGGGVRDFFETSRM